MAKEFYDWVFKMKAKEKQIKLDIDNRGRYTHKENVEYVAKKYNIPDYEADRIVLSTDFGNEKDKRDAMIKNHLRR
jgi:hypothetical protein